MTKTKTTAFSTRDTEALLHNIDKMMRKRRLFEQCPFTTTEMFHLFVEERDHAAVRRAAELFGVGSQPNTQSISFDSKQTDRPVTLEVKLSGVREFGFPLYATTLANAIWPNQSLFASSAHPEDIERFNEYCETKIRVALEYGLVAATFKELNRLCETPSQVAFLWPTIHHITTPDTFLLLHSKPKKIPGVSPGLRLMCQTSAATVAGHMMLPDAPAQDETVFVSFSDASTVIAEGPTGYAYRAI